MRIIDIELIRDIDKEKLGEHENLIEKKSSDEKLSKCAIYNINNIGDEYKNLTLIINDELRGINLPKDSLNNTEKMAEAEAAVRGAAKKINDEKLYKIIDKIEYIKGIIIETDEISSDKPNYKTNEIYDDTIKNANDIYNIADDDDDDADADADNVNEIIKKIIDKKIFSKMLYYNTIVLLKCKNKYFNHLTNIIKTIDIDMYNINNAAKYSLYANDLITQGNKILNDIDNENNTEELVNLKKSIKFLNIFYENVCDYISKLKKIISGQTVLIRYYTSYYKNEKGLLELIQYPENIILNEEDSRDFNELKSYLLSVLNITAKTTETAEPVESVKLDETTEIEGGGLLTKLTSSSKAKNDVAEQSQSVNNYDKMLNILYDNYKKLLTTKFKKIEKYIENIDKNIDENIDKKKYYYNIYKGLELIINGINLLNKNVIYIMFIKLIPNYKFDDNKEEEINNNIKNIIDNDIKKAINDDKFYHDKKILNVKIDKIYENINNKNNYIVRPIKNMD